MSLESWKKEFYPVDACEIEGLVDAAKHSLKKWEGLLSENRKKHGVILNKDSDLEEGGGGIILLDGTSCALCQVAGECVACPLNSIQNCCEDNSPYDNYCCAKSENERQEAVVRLISHLDEAVKIAEQWEEESNEKVS